MVFLSAFQLVVLCLILEFFMLPVCYILRPSLVFRRVFGDQVR